MQTIPYTTSVVVPSSAPHTYVKFASGVRHTSPPYNKPTEYSVYSRRSSPGPQGEFISASNESNNLTAGIAPIIQADNDLPSVFLKDRDQARRKAFGKFASLLEESPMTLVNVGESDTSLTMMSRRLTQLYKGFRALKSFRFYEAAKVFNLVRDSRPAVRKIGTHKRLRWTKHPISRKWYPRPKQNLLRKWSKDASGLYLEYAFGWAPLVKDVQTLVTALEKPLSYSPTPIRATSAVVGNNKETSWTPSYRYQSSASWKVRCTTGAVIDSGSNPNYELFSRLGLVDLASTALEMVPFSFVANWFFTLDSCIKSFSLSFDPRITNPWYSEKLDSSAQLDVAMFSGGVFLRTDAVYSSSATSYRRRVGSLPPQTIDVRPRFVTSLTRALNMSALIVQLFGKRA